MRRPISYPNYTAGGKDRSNDGWGRVVEEYQEHDGYVDEYTPHVNYAHDDGEVNNNGIAGYVRLEKVTYYEQFQRQFREGTPYTQLLTIPPTCDRIIPWLAWQE